MTVETVYSVRVLKNEDVHTTNVRLLTLLFFVAAAPLSLAESEYLTAITSFINLFLLLCFPDLLRSRLLVGSTIV